VRRQLLTEILAEGAARFPARDAVAAGGRRLTYAELDAASSRLAGALLAHGTRPGDRVALDLHKSIESVIAIYGIMKAGAAYVPIDPFAPPRRQAFIAGNCGIRTLVTARDMLDTLADAFADECPIETLVFLDGEAPALPPALARARALSRAEVNAAAVAPPAPAATDGDLAYILYTSGSTGDPKGVMITHRNALTFVEWAARRIGLRETDRVSNHAPFHFDLSIFDVFASHLAGATTCIVPDGAAIFPIEIARFIAANRITVWYSVPSILTALVTRIRLAEHDLSSLRLVLFAGEVFPVKYLRALMEAVPNAEYWNLYGPTETNVCTYHKVERPAADRDEPVPIGKAIEGVEVFAVDADGREVVPGGAGELLVKGDCVTSGYWGLPERTAAIFRQDPRHDDHADPVYKTGDLVRMEADGSYSFVARLDTMVKVRGYRVELGEIETALVNHPSVREVCALAVADDAQGNRLKVVIVPAKRGALTEKEVRAHCAARIPRYMVPEIVEFRDALPKTSTGKIDRARLAREAEPGQP
jgi:amino acid adenylation domain-containing protein